MQLFTRIAVLAAAAVPFLVHAAPTVAPRAEDVIPGKYIVQLKPDTDVASIAAHHNKVRSIHARSLARRGNEGSGVDPMEREYGFGNFKAYSGSFDEETIEELKALPKVLTVEEDVVMRINALVTQTNAPWGLASISSRKPGATSYIYDESAGIDTFSYVIAGTVGGARYGVAKKTNIIGVKVLDQDTGFGSNVLDGFDWAVNDIVAKGRQNTGVINISIGRSATTLWDDAVTAAWEQGVLVVTAAGNDGREAILDSPARSPELICVGNLRTDNTTFSRNPGSNHGSAVDIFAAGTDVESASHLDDSGTRFLTGTSMAAPHVAGLVAYLRALEGPSTAAEVKARVYELATPDVVIDPLGSANLLAYNGIN